MKAQKINIRNYQSNIEVFAEFKNQEDNGRIYSIETNSDTIPSASYIPTILDIIEKCDNLITREQASEIKHAIKMNMNF
jgi:hypothetical protein